jgi:hypothetical protein
MRKSLLNVYHELKESASESDFPYLLANTMYKKLLARFNGFPSPWRQYVMIGNLADFKTNDRVVLSEAEDLDEIESDGNYKDAKFSDKRYQIALKTYGKTFTVGRKAIINDDLDGITRFPASFGRATVRTMVKKILEYLKGGKAAYDGSNLFALRTAATRNYTANATLANTSAGMGYVIDCCVRMRGQTDPDSGELMGVQPWAILTGSTLAPIARQLIRSAQILPVSTNGGGTYNEIGFLQIVEEPLIDTEIGTAFWAVIANPADCPFLEVGFLDGKAEPDLLVKKAEMVSMAGGVEDPYGYEFDDLSYKVRHDWAIALAYYQGICRGHS